MVDLREQLSHCLQGRICLMGIGNPDCGDDGFGVRLAKELGRDLSLNSAEGDGFLPFPSYSYQSPLTGVPPNQSGTSSLINTGLQPGGQSPAEAGKPFQRFISSGEAVKTAGVAVDRTVTGLKPGVNERYGPVGQEALRSAPTGNVEVIIAGNAPERFIGRCRDEAYDHVVFLDAVDFRGVPGSVVFLDSDEMAARFPQVSTHKISLGSMAKWIESNGSTRVWLLGVQPASLARGPRLSEPVQRTFELLAQVCGQLLPPERVC